MDSRTFHGRSHPSPGLWRSQQTLKLENVAPLHVTSRHPEKKTTSDVQRMQKVIKLTIHIKGFGQGDLNSLIQQNVLSTYCEAVTIPSTIDRQPTRQKKQPGLLCGYAELALQESTTPRGRANSYMKGELLWLSPVSEKLWPPELGWGQWHFLIPTKVYYEPLEIMQVVLVLMEGSSRVCETLSR